jgi:hypothetical protein
MENQLLLDEIKFLKEENEHLKKLLENYSNSRKSYYEKNKDIVKQKAKDRLKKLSQENPEKIKEYAKKAYQKQKEKKNKIETII